MINDIQKEILSLKKQNNIAVLAHSYQAHDIIEIADFTGDSFAISTLAKDATQKTIIVCGVRFMAETVKILSPEKTVILANEDACCPMAEQMSFDEITDLKNKYPDYAVVAYINTTAKLKTACDVCVTSSSAEKIVNNLDSENILFIPDKNLGAYIKENVKNKNIILADGCCPVHAAVTEDDVKQARNAHPDAPLLVHPECPPEVCKLADFIGSTAAIMNFAKQSSKKEFIIGTEISIAEHLSFEFPDKHFFPLSKKLICADMKITSLIDVLNACKGQGGEEIILDEDTITKARNSIDKMIKLG